MVKASFISYFKHTGLSKVNVNPGGSKLPPFAVLLFSAVIFVVLAGLAVTLAWQQYRSEIALAEERSLAAAHLVATNIHWMMEASDQALQRIDAAFGAETIRSSPDKIVLLDEAVNGLPSGFQYSVYDETGRLRLSSVPEAVGINVSDREYFQELRDGADLVVSPLIDERLSGQKVFVIAQRIVRDGQFHGAASIAVPVVKLAEFWSSMNLSPASTVAVVGTDGWLAARYPSVEKTMKLSDTPLISLATESGHGFYENPASAVDGRSRIVGFWKVDEWPLIATVGIDRDQALQRFWSDLVKGLLLGVPVLVFLFAGLLWIRKLLKVDAQTRADLEATLEQNRFLLREIHHRVKNNLQTVLSLVRLQKMPDDARASISGRIAAMAAAHEHMYATDQFEDVDAAPYLERIVENFRDSHPSSTVVDARLVPLIVHRDKALPLGLLANELLTNAAKHAFPDGQEGTIRIELLSEDDEQATMVVSDDGVGMAADDAPKNMGSRLIEAFARQLDGSLEFRSEGGTTAILKFPTA